MTLHSKVNIDKYLVVQPGKLPQTRSSQGNHQEKGGFETIQYRDMPPCKRHNVDYPYL